MLFALRDNLVRALHAAREPGDRGCGDAARRHASSPLVWARRLPSRGELRGFAPAGLLFGLSYVCLFEAYFHGPVSVVSPLVATESLWGVGLSALVLGASEGVGPRLVVGARSSWPAAC